MRGPAGPAREVTGLRGVAAGTGPLTAHRLSSGLRGGRHVAVQEERRARRPSRPRTGTSGPRSSVAGLTKNYGEIEAVRGIDFEVPAGETFGFLGPNGAGKSTTIKMLCTLARPDVGGRRASPATTWSPSATRCAATSGWSSRTPRSTTT